MSLKAIVWAFDQELFSATQKFVLVAYANFASETGKTYPSIETVSRLTSQKESTVRKAVAGLTKDGFMSDTGKKAGPTQRVKVYQLPVGACEMPPKRGVLTNPESAPNTPPNQPRIPPISGGRTSNSEQEQGTELPLNEEQRRKPFQRPSLEQVVGYLKTQGLTSADGEYFWNAKEGVGWHKVKNWEAAVRSWKVAGYFPSQKQNHRNGESSRPTGCNL